MKNCGIMRVEKRARSAVHGISLENNRTKEEHERTGIDFPKSDIDWERTPLNYHLKKCDHWNSEITKQIKEKGLKPRKNSIMMLDGFFSASPEWFDSHTEKDRDEFFQECYDFYVKEYCSGDDSKVFNAVVHLDENTPHLHICSVPTIEDEEGYHLSAKIIMGNNVDYRKRQDRFWEEVTKKRGLERGEIRDPANTKKHTTKREWQLATQEKQIEENDKRIAEQKKQIEENDKRITEQNTELDATKKELKFKQDHIISLRGKEHNLNEKITKLEEKIDSKKEEKKGITHVRISKKQRAEEQNRMKELEEELKKKDDEINRLNEYKKGEIITQVAIQTSEITKRLEEMEEYKEFYEYWKDATSGSRTLDEIFQQHKQGGHQNEKKKSSSRSEKYSAGMSNSFDYFPENKENEKGGDEFEL